MSYSTATVWEEEVARASIRSSEKHTPEGATSYQLFLLHFSKKRNKVEFLRVEDGSCCNHRPSGQQF